MKPLVALRVMALVAVAAGARADIVPTAQDRSVFASSSPGSSPQQTFTAPDFGPFDQTAHAQSFGPFNDNGNATAVQNSTIGALALAATGSADAFASVGSTSTVATSSARSTYQVDFALLLPTDLRLVAHLTAASLGGQAASGSTTTLELRDMIGQTVVASGTAAYTGPTSVDFDAVYSLAPGSYRLRVVALGGVQALPLGPVNDRNARALDTYSVQLTVVPGPPAGVLLAFGLALRRRRR